MVDKRRDIENEREELISSAKEERVQLGIKTSDYFHEVDFEFRATLRRFYGARLTYNEAVAGGAASSVVAEAVAGLSSAVTADTALRLSRFFGMSDRFWLNLQTRYDLGVEKDRLGARLLREVEFLRKRVESFCGHSELKKAGAVAPCVH